MELSQQLMAVGSVLSLLICGIALARRRGWITLSVPVRAGAPRSLEVIDRLVLTPQHSVHLVRAHDRVLLIATHPHGVEFADAQASRIPAPLASKMAAAAGSNGASQ